MKLLLIVYDNYSFIPCFPLGVGYIAAALRKEGHEVFIYFQDKEHSTEKCLIKYLDDNKFDMVGLGMIAGYTQYRKFIDLSKAINDSKNRDNFVYIIAGTMVTPEPRFFLKKMRADIAILGEGEETIIELLDKKFDCVNVKGVAYKCVTSSNKYGVKVNSRRETIKNIDKIPMPAYDMFPMDHYRLLRIPGCQSTDFVMEILSGRGCSYRCNFCYRCDPGFRPRSNNSIIQEIEYLKENYGINYIVFNDELLMSSEERTISFCEDLEKSKLNVKWSCEGRLNFAKLNVLKRMKDTGCQYVNYGIESFDNAMLKIMKKGLNVKIIIDGIENTLKVGISPGLNFIFGNIGESFDVLKKDVDFLLKYSDNCELRTIRPVTPYPGCPLYYYAIENGLLKDVEDFYENKLVNSDLVSVNFTQYSDEEVHKALYGANSQLIEAYCDYHKNKTLDTAKKLYYNKDSKSFRGFRPVV